jgi:hypothetical protein
MEPTMNTPLHWTSNDPHRRALREWAAGLLWMLPLLFVAAVASLAVAL